MKTTIYLIGDPTSLGEWGEEKKIQVDRFDFDSSSDEDMEILSDYIEELPFTKEQFIMAAKKYVSDNEDDWTQRLCPCFIIDDRQAKILFKELPKVKNNDSEKSRNDS